MLAKDPAQRPQTMTAVAAALEAYSLPPAARVIAVAPARTAPIMAPVMRPLAPRRRFTAYAVGGLVVVGAGLGAAWQLDARPEAPVVAPVAAPLPAAAAIAAPAKPVEPSQVQVQVDGDAPGARVTFRRHTIAAPLTTQLASSTIVEMVEVSAPGFRTERYWLTLDRATHLRAHLVRGTGLEEASELRTLAALGEAPAAPVAEKTVARALPARKIGHAPEVTDDVAWTEPAKVDASPVVEAAAVPDSAFAAPAPAVDAPTEAVAVNAEPAPPAEPVPAPAPAAEAPAPAPIVEAPPVVAARAIEEPRPKFIDAPVRHNVSPALFQARRTSGSVELDAPIAVQKEMVRDSATKVTALVKACIGADGAITQVSLIKSSGYEGYDQVLLDGVRGWHFQAGDPVCSAVAFAFKPGR